MGQGDYVGQGITWGAGGYVGGRGLREGQGITWGAGDYVGGRGLRGGQGITWGPEAVAKHMYVLVYYKYRYMFLIDAYLMHGCTTRCPAPQWGGCETIMYVRNRAERGSFFFC